MAWPSTITAFTNPLPTDRLNSPSHSSIETAQNTGLTEVQTFLGTMNASALGTLIGTVYNASSDGGGHVQSANKGGTGQTSYNKGDLLVAQSSSVLTKLAVGGTDGNVLKVDSGAATGVSWGNAALGAPTVRVYTSSVVDIWVKPSTLSFLFVELVGGGGGGGAFLPATNFSTGPGGGGGGYTRKIIPASSVPAAVSVRAGSGGLGSILSGGANGGLSYFGSIISALGGQGAPLGGGQITPGAGGAASIIGDFEIVGESGQGGQNSSFVGRYYAGKGGDSFMGFGGNLNTTGSSNGQTAGKFGGGGSGGVENRTSIRGGNGADGVVIVHEY